jgi:hypothetical protein
LNEEAQLGFFRAALFVRNRDREIGITEETQKAGKMADIPQRLKPSIIQTIRHDLPTLPTFRQAAGRLKSCPPDMDCKRGTRQELM